MQTGVSAGDTDGHLVGTPLAADARGGPGSDVGVALLAMELNLLVLPDPSHVRPVLVLADDPDEQDLAVVDGAGVAAVHCRHTGHGHVLRVHSCGHHILLSCSYQTIYNSDELSEFFAT